MKAVFLDRVDDNRVSRLIIDIRYDQDRSQEVVVCLLITKEFKVEVSYPIDDWNSFDNAMLIAVDFKFSKESPFVNLDTFNENSVYAAL
ncbi:hypothetical protein [Vibrio agarivorans]|nr:hypothetical protein [Vibrio agarivorans]MDN3660865.1 hypothetical protein [Vibrio agarivorans]